MPPAPADYDVAVIGLGAAGSATLSALARAGVRAIGIDRYRPPHRQGSSHGETRLLRRAYAEGPYYVPLIDRAIALWKTRERDAGETLFEQTGVVYAGPADNPFIAGTLASSRLKQVRLHPARGLDRWFALGHGAERLREREGGYVYPERAIHFFLSDARRHGATLALNCACEGFDRRGKTIVIRTARGPVRARRIVIAAGAWADQVVPGRALKGITYIERRVLHWFADPDGLFVEPAGFKPFALGTEDGQMLYGFPANARGEVKVGEHSTVAIVASPSELDRRIGAADKTAIETLVRRHMPALGRRLRSLVCMYPMAPDERFILDRHPDDPRFVIGAGLSGHGFKFAPAIGEALANLALDRPQAVDIGPFRFPRQRAGRTIRP